jgi:Ser/Thr protein kinase RdoA (MazF antagonist)
LLVLSLVPGRILDDRGDFFDVGAQLARIHSIGFEEWGLFQPDGSLETFSPDLGGQMIAGYLDGRAGSRLGSSRVATVRTLEPASLHPRAPTLVHSDFNPKNILIGPGGEVTAVLDWEFAMAADPLIDLGNFFRFPEDYHAKDRDKFLEGYRKAGGLLPEDWQRQALLHDLVSLLDFLNSEKDHPETFATALDRLDRALALLQR